MPIGQAVGAGLGLLLGEVNDRRQIRQQEKLQRMQIEGQKEMGQYNQQLALDMWDKTNYAAQVAQMQKAGLSVGLMYGNGGAGGTTQTPTGNVSGGTAAGHSGEVGMGMQLGLQAAMQEAQIENVKADTEVKKKEAGEKLGTPEKAITDIDATKADIELKKQQIKNEKFKTEISKWQEQQEIINTNVADKNQHEVIKQMASNTKQLEAEANQAAIKAGVDKEVANEIVKAAKLQNIETGLRMTATKLGMKQTEEQTKKIAQEIMNMPIGVSFEARKVRVQEILAQFTAGGEEKRTSETVTNYTSQIIDLIDAIIPY